jgi:hypothetical protein
MTTEEIKERLAKLPEAEWVTQMRRHYAQTGAYKPQDLRRLLGDPNQRAEMTADRSMPKYFLDR